MTTWQCGLQDCNVTEKLKEWEFFEPQKEDM
jgi:hypothetical protein